MTIQQVDLTNCDRELIHIPGKVQSHGFLVAIDGSYVINYVSENLSEYLPIAARDLLGKPVAELEALIQVEEIGFITQMIQLGKHAKSFETINPYHVDIHEEGYNLIISQSGPNFLLEFEPVSTDTEVDIQKTIGRSVTEMLTGRQLKHLLENAAEQIKTLIGYDRIMIYKFLDDGHGEVIAEVKEDHLEPFLGLHYPATDIPQQARELYKINLTRIITDVNKEDSRIITLADDGEAKPLDLTHSALRAVSPIHIQYLKNMGVASSFSISLLYRDQLWGLIACHSYSPRFINFKAREASKLIGQIISSALEYKQDEENTAKSNEYKTALEVLASTLNKGGNIADAITKGVITVQNVTDATGVVVFYEDQLLKLGSTPGDDELKALADWLKQNMADKLYHTHQLPEVYQPARAYSAVASGLLAISLSKEMGEMIVWFKPEQITTINWAGDPNKPAELNANGSLSLSPRRSFDVWSQTVKHTSERWTREEITSALKLREDVVFAINRQANEIRTLNEKLKQAYEELDTFSFTVSHDLRTPLSTIKNYSELLLESNTSLDDDARRILNKIIGGADKLNFLIKEVLNYSRVGRAELHSMDIDMKQLLNELKGDLSIAFKLPDLEFKIGDTPTINGDRTMITQVFLNLLNNAIKYSARSNPPTVSVEGREYNNEVIYIIKDNGVGIDVNYFNRIFDLFKRMDNVRDYEGTGVGLAIVKRIIEKHNARIWVESELGVGTIFYIAFRKTDNGRS
ncbi:GAF domain-containing protein [Mucilaginibacter daejeonensis]|uniref:ATP-binding protein n=1 Tax=Mucilaginibacter daejeonensis TaxID=398049 RepID=UPI001D174F4D|nr:ATP-binding protein [Mucilaginibacter daejeonensis]UEG55259.1 GAF domain-containing protein [Mucilaginibacter daejeonensis]